MLTKRKYMSKDLLLDRYGRFYELPKYWVQDALNIEVYCLSYQRIDTSLYGRVETDNIAWCCFGLCTASYWNAYSYVHQIMRVHKPPQPDVILAWSDAIQVILGSVVARRLKKPLVVDLYDNFESYGQCKIPGVLPLFRRAIRQAKLISCISPELSQMVKQRYRPKGEIITIENAVPEGFHSNEEKATSRTMLGFTDEVKYIGTAGALDSSRGISDLIRAFQSLTQLDKNIHLVLAGPLSKDVELHENDRIHYLGELDYSDIPRLYNALDVGVICNKDSDFGKYCFPQKAYEMLACRVPVVAADVGVMHRLFARFPNNLYRPGDHLDLEYKIRIQLNNPILPELPIPTWKAQANEMASKFRNLIL